MSLAADLMILIGAVLLTIGTDLVINTAGTQSAVGAPIGVLASIVGTTVMVSGILISRRRTRRQSAEPPASNADGPTA
jgi:predicted tellurium resistance membrane protein TerC